MDISIVTTTYHSADYIEEFYSRVKKTVESITPNYEIIFVNDGSEEFDSDLVLKFQKENSKVVLVELSRNFGHHPALMEGISNSTGDLVFVLDSDLEEDPELLPDFLNKLKAEKADVVYGVQESRKGNFIERISGALFYLIFNWISRHKIETNVSTVRLMSRAYVEKLKSFKESELFIFGIFSLTGFHQIPISFSKHSKGKSMYTIRRKMYLFVNAITSFSEKPLEYIFYAGCMLSLSSLVFATVLVVRKFLWGFTVTGYASLIVSIWFLSGVIIFFLGIVGIYISKVFIEVKNRPRVIIRRIHRTRSSSHEDSI